jgi:hypothetical protein
LLTETTRFCQLRAHTTVGSYARPTISEGKTGQHILPVCLVFAFVADAAVGLTAYYGTEGLEHMITVNLVFTMMSAMFALSKLQETADTKSICTNLTIVDSLYHCMVRDD